VRGSPKRAKTLVSLKERDRRDLLVLECKHDESERPRDRGVSVVEVAAEGGLAVGARRHEVDRRAAQAGPILEEEGDGRFPLVLKRVRRHQKCYFAGNSCSRLGHGIGPWRALRCLTGQLRLPICTHFERRERRGLEPATSGMTGRVGHRNVVCRTVCAHFQALLAHSLHRVDTTTWRSLLGLLVAGRECALRVSIEC
jgi:hypothetical protein